VATFSIATNREWVTKDGQRHAITEYHDLVAWARLAEICGQHLRKGKLIYVEGYLKTRSWDSPEGIKKFKTEIVVQDLIMLDKRERNDNFAEFVPELDSNGAAVYEPEKSEPVAFTPAPRPAPASAPIHTPAPTPVHQPAPMENHSHPKAVDIDSDLGL
jgi:single-strand DNA-binding protein